jgi:hypothetical protein
MLGNFWEALKAETMSEANEWRRGIFQVLWSIEIGKKSKID